MKRRGNLLLASLFLLSALLAALGISILGWYIALLLFEASGRCLRGFWQ